MGERTYQAFISYRHLPLDVTAAKAIHQRLEAYRIPASIRRKTSRKKVGRCFRDRDELPTSSDLAHDIIEALKDSNWLIVVCTPETPKSKWCLSEIETFIEMHGRARVMAVLVEGEPAESFPEVLRFETLADGTRIEREPLAADLRSKSAAALRRNLRVEKLRLIAPMLGVGFDELRRRARERLLRITVAASISAAGFFAVFGGYTLSQAGVISRQSDEINRKNVELVAQIDETNRQKELAEANEQLAKENEARALIGESEAKRHAGIAQTNEELALANEAKALLNEAEARKQAGIAQENETRAIAGEAEAVKQTGIAQVNEARAVAGEFEAQRQAGIARDNEAHAISERDKALIGQSKFLASLSESVLNSGDASLASLLALNGLPYDPNTPNRPLVAEAEKALRNASITMSAWKETALAPTAILNSQVSISDYRLLEDLFIAVLNQEIRMWNTKSGEAYPPVQITASGRFGIYIHKQTPIVRLYYGSRVEVYELRVDRSPIVKSHRTITLCDEEIFSGKMVCTPDENRFLYYQWHYTDSNTGSVAKLYVSEETTGALYELPMYYGGEKATIECLDIFGSRGVASITVYYETGSKNSAFAFDINTGERLFELDYYQDPRFFTGFTNPSTVRYSNDGSLIATITRGVVELFDGYTGKWIAALNDKQVEEDFYNKYAGTVKFSDDDKHVATLSADSVVRVYNAATGEEEFSYGGETLNITSFTWYDGRLLVATTSQIILLDISDVTSLDILSVLTMPASILAEVVYTSTAKLPAMSVIDLPPGKTSIAVLLDGNKVQIMHTVSAPSAPVHILTGGRGRDVSVSNTGCYIAICDNADLRLYDSSTGEVLRKVRIKSSTSSADRIDIIGWRSNDSKLFIVETGNYAGRTRPTLMEYDIDADVLTSLYEIPISLFYDLSKISKDIFVLYDEDQKTFRTCDLETGLTLHEIPAPDNADQFCIQKGGYLVALYAGECSGILIYDAQTGESVQRVTGSTQTLTIAYRGVSISPDGRHLTALLQDHTFIIWDITSGQIVYSSDAGITSSLYHW